MHSSYPIALDLFSKPCLVVGGGALAVDKVHGLVRAGARVTVIAETAREEIRGLADTGAVDLHRRPYTAADLDSVYLAYGASEDRDLNAAVAADARARGILVNAVDDIPNCDFFAVALVRRGDLQIAVSTNGRSPAFARWMREYLDASLPDDLGEVVEVMGCVRDEVRAQGQVPAYERWREAIDDEVLDHAEAHDRGGSRVRVLAHLSADLSQAAATELR